MVAPKYPKITTYSPTHPSHCWHLVEIEGEDKITCGKCEIMVYDKAKHDPCYYDDCLLCKEHDDKSQ